MRGVLLLFLLSVSALLLWLQPRPQAVYAQAPTPVPTRVVTDDEVNAVAKKLYCPVCENIPLDTCETKACEEWRQLIRKKLEEGWSEQQILEYFAARYGERVLAEPRPRGAHLVFYVLPPVLVVAGVAILYRVLRAWRNLPESATSKQIRMEPGTSQGAQAPETPDEYRRRLEEELRDL